MPERVHVVRWHDFIVVFIARAFVFFGLALLMTFVLYFFQDMLHYTNPAAGTAFIGIFSLLGAIVSSVVLGVLSDRYSRRILTAVCGLPMAIAAIGFAIAPNQNAMLIYAIFFGVGLGGILSVGWALAIDSLPQLTDVARDLGIWGIATNLPAVIAPIVGGWVFHVFDGSRAGYQLIFALSGISFVFGSLTVLRVGASDLVVANDPLWVASMISVNAGMHLRHRVRSWGRLKRDRGGTLVVANHQTDLEAMIVVSGVGWHSSWRHPVFAASSGRMYEPGFFAIRFPRLYWLMRRVSLGPLFRAIGLMPIENELSARSLSSLAWSVEQRHDPVPLTEMVTDPVASKFPPGTRTCDLWKAEHFMRAQEVVKLSRVREPYRSEIVAEMRDLLEAHIVAMEEIVDRGATFYITPEGQHSHNGELRPLRGLLPRLSKYAKTIYLAGVSFDVFNGKKFSALYNLVELRERDDIADELIVARPVTVTQLLAAYLHEKPGAFNEGDAIDAVEQSLSALPAVLFIDPELKRDPRGITRAALMTMVRKGFLTGDGSGNYRISRRTDPLFFTDDIYAYHARFLAQSVESATKLLRVRPELCPTSPR